MWIHPGTDRISVDSSDSESMSLSKLDEMIDVCQTALDEIWRLPNHYPQNRMCSIFDMICRSPAVYCVSEILFVNFCIPLR